MGSFDAETGQRKKKQVSLETCPYKIPKLNYKEKNDEKDKEGESKMVVWEDTEFPPHVDRANLQLCMDHLSLKMIGTLN